MIRELEGEGHEVVITCRPWPHDRSAGPAWLPLRSGGGPLRRQVLDEAVRLSDPRLAVVALPARKAHRRGDFAELVSLAAGCVAARCALDLHGRQRNAMGNIPSGVRSKIMVPEFLTSEKLRKQWANPRKVVNYPGVKEGIDLWDLDERLRRPGAAARGSRLGRRSTFAPSRGRRNTTRAAGTSSTT